MNWDLVNQVIHLVLEKKVFSEVVNEKLIKGEFVSTNHIIKDKEDVYNIYKIRYFNIKQLGIENVLGYESLLENLNSIPKGNVIIVGINLLEFPILVFCNEEELNTIIGTIYPKEIL